MKHQPSDKVYGLRSFFVTPEGKLTAHGFDEVLPRCNEASESRPHYAYLQATAYDPRLMLKRHCIVAIVSGNKETYRNGVEMTTESLDIEGFIFPEQEENKVSWQRSINRWPLMDALIIGMVCAATIATLLSWDWLISALSIGLCFIFAGIIWGLAQYLETKEQAKRNKDVEWLNTAKDGLAQYYPQALIVENTREAAQMFGLSYSEDFRPMPRLKLVGYDEDGVLRLPEADVKLINGHPVVFPHEGASITAMPEVDVVKEY